MKSTKSIDKGDKLKFRQLSFLAGLCAVLLVLAAGCGSSSSSGGSVKLNLVAYSTPAEVYAKLIPAFNKTAAGKGVGFNQSYGASGDQSRAVVAGQPADVVHFSLEPDMARLVDAKLVSSSWDQNQFHGIVANSVVVFIVRKGNPKNIKTWADLTKPGVQVVTPNPFTSGGARWNIMAAYGAQLKQGKSPAEAEAYLGQLFKNVVVQPDSARDALQTFVGGKGDVLLDYENDAILAQEKSEPVDYVIPDQTILIQTPAAVTSNTSHATQAKAFLNFLWSKQGQQILADNGYRPVLQGVTSPKYSYPTPPQLFDINYVGGWDSVMTKFFDPTNGIVAKIEQSNGVSTGG